MKKINQINKKERDIELAFVALLIIYIYVCSYFFDRLREGCPVFEKVLFHLSEEQIFYCKTGQFLNLSCQQFGQRSRSGVLHFSIVDYVLELKVETSGSR